MCRLPSCWARPAPRSRQFGSGIYDLLTPRSDGQGARGPAFAAVVGFAAPKRLPVSARASAAGTQIRSITAAISIAASALTRLCIGRTFDPRPELVQAEDRCGQLLIEQGGELDLLQVGLR